MTHRTWAGRYVARLALPVILAGAVAAWLAVDPGFQRNLGNAGLSTDVPKDEFERRVRDYLLAHPDVIIQSVNQLEARQRAKAETEVQDMIKSRADEIFQDAAAPTGGDPKGDVTLVEFFDYNCPYCRQVVPVMAKAEEADPQLRIAYKEFPILGPNSTYAAKAALAANKQGKYVAFHRGLYGVRGGRRGEGEGSRGGSGAGYGSPQGGYGGSRHPGRDRSEYCIGPGAPYQRHAGLRHRRSNPARCDRS
jgi:protein-disulfide isomerase